MCKYSFKLSVLRVSIVIFCFLATFIMIKRAVVTEPVGIIRPLSLFPRQIGSWKVNASRLSDEDVVKMLGVDDYIDYTYVNQSGRQVNLYVAFYKSVGGGKGYHSPKNCLPGAGWGIDRNGTITIFPSNKNGKRSVDVSEMIIREGDEYQVVFYWFQNRGRIIASEYWEKIYLVLDALIKHRRDGTFVRLIARAPKGKIAETEKILVDFSGDVLSELEQFLPGK